MAKTIMIATALIAGGVLAKSGSLEPFEVKPGEELTEAKCKKLGLTEDDVATLIDKGTIEEVPVRTAEEASAADDGAALAAANKRADDAEAQVKELTAKVSALEADLAKATEPAKTA